LLDTTLLVSLFDGASERQSNRGDAAQVTEVASTTWLAMLLGGDQASPAVIDGDDRYTLGELLALGRGAASWLDAMDVPAGVAVPSLLTSNVGAMALVIGGAGSARPIAPLGPRHTAHELAGCISRLDSPVVACEAAFEAVATEAAALTGTRLLVLDRPQPSTRPFDVPEPMDVGFYLHTSGTSGQPKAVPYREGALVARAAVNGMLLEMAPGEVYMSASTFHHIACIGNFAAALASGAAVACMPRFSVEGWRRLADVGVTLALLVPTMVEMLIAEDALALPDLRLLHYGAAPIHPDTLARVIELLPDVHLAQIFGQTEGSPISVLTPEDHRLAAKGRTDLLSSVGRAAPGVDLHNEAPDGAGIGEVWSRAPFMYLPGPDGWLHTGDLGALDAEGYLFLSGRLGERIIRGGENIYPLEVEHVLGQHPGVVEAAVVGVPDRHWGEIVKGVVVPTDLAAPPSTDELRAFVRARLSGYKVPAVWEFVGELPRNANGKVLKRLLR
jgi:acyl-CoA synthetase (AMP-forming)/AMP-acid ligase II